MKPMATSKLKTQRPEVWVSVVGEPWLDTSVKPKPDLRDGIGNILCNRGGTDCAGWVKLHFLLRSFNLVRNLCERNKTTIGSGHLFNRHVRAAQAIFSLRFTAKYRLAKLPKPRRFVPQPNLTQKVLSGYEQRKYRYPRSWPSPIRKVEAR